MGWNAVTGLSTPAATKNVGALIKITIMDVEQQLVPRAGTRDCGTGEELPLAVLRRGWTGCPVDRQTDRRYCCPALLPPAAAGAFVCRSQAGGGSPQKNSLVKAFRCFMNKLDSTYSIINLLYSDGLRGRLSCAWTNQYLQIHTNTGF